MSNEYGSKSKEKLEQERLWEFIWGEIFAKSDIGKTYCLISKESLLSLLDNPSSVCWWKLVREIRDFLQESFGYIVSYNAEWVEVKNLASDDHKNSRFKAYTKKELEDLWEEFGDLPMNPVTEEMEAPFLHFPAGTWREDIWHWFDVRYPGGVVKLMYPSMREE